MIAGARALAQLLGIAPRPGPAGIRPRGRSRRRLARGAVAWGAAAFVLATAGLAVSVETIRPEWRDPEYGHRIHQLRRWEVQAPTRPRVLVFGSSRTQMSIAPAAMGFADEPGSPLVYNFGYRAGRLFRSCFLLQRVLDDGVRPDFVLIQISMIDLMGGIDGELMPAEWGSRLSAGDFGRLGPYLPDQSDLRRAWLAARLNGWSAHRQSILSDLLPRWQPRSTRLFEYYWERMDRYGFEAHHLEAPTPEYRRAQYERSRRVHAPAFAGAPVSLPAEQAVRDAVDRCVREGIPLAFFWAPESISYRSWYSDSARREMNRFEEWLASEMGVPVFPAPELPDADFVDGFHMIRKGAEKYSRWVATTHLGPWLARHGK